MKKYKKILAAILAFALMGTTCAFAAESETAGEETTVAETATEETTTEESEFDIPEKVEISFKVGDDTLIINGESVKVETAPYVVGEGTTLVPVRVITEAFGAKVGWDGETRTVTLDYPDIKIVLQIGNPVAEVNGEAVKLLAAPELPDGRTMVPLRFISETFGADVGYDEETRGITVTKETVVEGSTVEGVVETKYIGDSFYGWSMLNPKNLLMSSRSFDGSSTKFADEEGSNSITVKISNKSDDYDVEKVFKSGKELYQSLATLVKAEKNTDDENCIVLRLEARASTRYYCDIVYVTEKYVYSVTFTVENTEEKKAEFFELAESFVLKFEQEDTHDLSNLENGMRRFESEEMNFTLLLPATMTGGTSGLKINQFNFESNAAKYLSLGIEIISKSEATKTPVGYVEADMEATSYGANTDIVTVSELKKTAYGESEMFEYSFTVNGSYSGDCIGKYMSFELGDYIYIITVLIDAEYDTAPEQVIDSIVSNMKFEKIDQNVAGIIMDSRDDSTDTEDKEIKFGNIVFKAPYYYVSETYNSVNYIYNEERGIDIGVLSQVMPSSMSLSEVANALKSSIIGSVELEDDQKLTSSDVKKTQIDKKVFYKFSYEITGKDYYEYNEVYFYQNDGLLYIMIAYIPEMYKSDVTLKEVDTIIKSVEKAK